MPVPGAAVLFPGELTFMAATGLLRCRSEFATEPYFTPTSASWLNAVEGYFAKLTRRRLKRGVFRSIVELQAAIKRFLAEITADPRPSAGPRISIKSSPQSKEGTKC